ncbi:MAG: nucleotidyltransferase family protein [Acidobacteriia bacterium]|nr:nucleotidyltransferase family protein [Terriglobia bacterium]
MSSASLSVAGLILAAGESRRMGFPKALLPYRGETFLDTLVGLLAARCRPVIVVLGASAEHIRARSSRPATFVVNPHYPSGQTSSMQCGLRAVPPDTEGVLFTLVDHPAVAPETIDALLGGWEDLPHRIGASGQGPGAGQRESMTLLRVPRYQGRRGHPIWLSRELIPEFLALPEDGAARDVVRSHALQTQFLDVDDPSILADIDDPEAYRLLTGAAT